MTLWLLLLTGCDGMSGKSEQNYDTAHSGNASFSSEDGVYEGDTELADYDSTRMPKYSGAWDPPPIKAHPLSGDARARQKRFTKLINSESQRANIDAAFIHAITTVESVYKPNAQSGVGAGGLMQIMPATGRELGITPSQRFDPQKNVRAGIKYFKQMKWANGNLQAMAAGYNCGPGRAKILLKRMTGSKYWGPAQTSSRNGVPGPKYHNGETHNYARKMAGYYDLYKANPHLIGLAEIDHTTAGSACEARDVC